VLTPGTFRECMRLHLDGCTERFCNNLNFRARQVNISKALLNGCVCVCLTSSLFVLPKQAAQTEIRMFVVQPNTFGRYDSHQGESFLCRGLLTTRLWKPTRNPPETYQNEDVKSITPLVLPSRGFRHMI
jgi:hypothetical protein